jgi:hypothetical protein
MSVKNSNDTNGNRTCDIPACSAVPINCVWKISVSLSLCPRYHDISRLNVGLLRDIVALFGDKIKWTLYCRYLKLPEIF